MYHFPECSADMMIETETCSASAGSRADVKQAEYVERGIIATLWHNIDHLLSGGSAVGESLRLLTSALPPLEFLETKQLPQLSRLHVSSASSMMDTLRLLAPSAFAGGKSNPDEQLLAQLDHSMLSIASCLIDLQLFHLQRAALLSATSRRRSLPRSCTPVVSDHSCLHTLESSDSSNTIDGDSCTDTESLHDTY